MCVHEALSMSDSREALKEHDISEKTIAMHGLCLVRWIRQLAIKVQAGRGSKMSPPSRPAKTVVPCGPAAKFSWLNIEQPAEARGQTNETGKTRTEPAALAPLSCLR